MLGQRRLKNGMFAISTPAMNVARSKWVPMRSRPEQDLGGREISAGSRPGMVELVLRAFRGLRGKIVPEPAVTAGSVHHEAREEHEECE